MTAYNFYYINGATQLDIITYIFDFTLERELEKLLDKLIFKCLRSIDNLNGFTTFDPHVEIYLTFNGTGIFRGRVKSSNKKTYYEVEAYSSAEILQRTVVQQVYTNTTPEDIFTALISGYTDLTPITTASGTTMERFLVDDYLYTVIQKLVETLGWYCYTDSAKNIYFKPRGTVINDIVIRRQKSSSNAIFGEWKREHNEMCNDIRITGDNINYSTTNSFTGDFSSTIFTLSEIPITMKVTVDSVEQSPDNYIIAKDSKTVTLNTAPASSLPVVMSYDYAYPIYAARENTASVNTYGRFTKCITNKWLKTRPDATAYANNYIDAYADPLLYNNIQMNAGYITSFTPGEKVRVIDDLESIDDYLVINKIKLEYKSSIVNLNIGDYLEQFIGIQRVLQSRIKELEKQDMRLTLQINSNQSETLTPAETLDESETSSINFKLITYQARCDYGRGTLYDARVELCQT